jgi:hypothetical protein
MNKNIIEESGIQILLFLGFEIINANRANAGYNFMMVAKHNEMY